MSNVNNLDITVKYKFDPKFQPQLLRGYSTILLNAINGFNLAGMVLNLRNQDLSTDIEGKLTKLVNDIRQFEHNNGALLNNPMPYVTANKKDIVALRKELHDIVYDLIGRYDDVLVAVKLQAFQLTKFATHTADSTVEHLNAQGGKVESTESQTAKMALANLQLINWFFDSVIKSNAMQALADGLDVVQHTEPSVSFGPTEFTDADLDKAIPHKERLEF